MQTSTVYSAKIYAGEGFYSPAPLADIPGWEVSKQGQTEIYVIHHGLGLADPERDMHVVATSMSVDARVIVSNLSADSFTVSAWTQPTEPPLDLAPTQTDFMFVATYSDNERRPTAPTDLTFGAETLRR